MRAETSAAALELARGPRVLGTPHPVLRALLERDYAGLTHAPRHSDTTRAARGALLLRLLAIVASRTTSVARFARKGSSVSVSSATT
jgi:hypothetical protein